MGYSFRSVARVLLYASSQDNTYHSLCYTSREALAGMRNSSMSPPCRIDPMTSHHKWTLIPQSYISLWIKMKLFLQYEYCSLTSKTKAVCSCHPRHTVRWWFVHIKQVGKFCIIVVTKPIQSFWKINQTFNMKAVKNKTKNILHESIFKI